jgi:hypothetical protein
MLNRSGAERHFRPVAPELGGGYHALVEVFVSCPRQFILNLLTTSASINSTAS